MSGADEPLPPDEFRALVREALPRFGLVSDTDRVERLARFLAELDRWRRTTNLTGRLTARELSAHALESVLGERFLPRSVAVVDIGTGGGFPGVPLALWRPDLSVTWLEPRRRRAEFLTHIQRTLGVENAKVLAGRASVLPASAFDFATARAVPLTGGVFGNARFLRPGGGFLLWTTAAKETPPELRRAGFRLAEALPIPGSVRRAIALYRRA